MLKVMLVDRNSVYAGMFLLKSRLKVCLDRNEALLYDAASTP
jgi:hypothetical protein